MTTILDIVDTIVKIGLGALISGVTTYYVSIRDHSHERDKDLLVYKRNKLVEISEKIQLAGELSNNLKSLISQKTTNSKTLSDKDISGELEIAKNVCNIIGSAVSISHLINDQELANLTKEYWKNRNALYVYLLKGDKSNLKEYRELSSQMSKIRLKILDQYSKSLVRIYAE